MTVVRTRKANLVESVFSKFGVARDSLLFFRRVAKVALKGREQDGSWQVTPQARPSPFRALPDAGARTYLSLTTLPNRIGHVAHVLGCIDLAPIEKVFLALPERTLGGQQYVIPESLRQHPKIQILRPTNDLGPATKLLPAAAFLQANDPDARLITIDDDKGYPFDLAYELIFAATGLPGATITVSGQKTWGYGLFGSWPRPGRANSYSLLADGRPALHLSQVDIVEGFSGVIYPVSKVNVARIQRLLALSPACRASDDVIISLALALDRCPVYRFARGPVFTVADLRPFPYSYVEGSLMLGAERDRITLRQMLFENQNAKRYRLAWKDLAAFRTERSG